jgi:hypothetical protein
MILTAFVEVLLPVLVVALCGYALRRAFHLDLRSLNRVSLYILSPALIFVTLARIEISGGEALRVAAVSALFPFVIGALTFVCAKPLRLDKPSLAALLLCTMFMNAGNFGLPTTRFAFGEEGFQRALLFFIPQTILAQVLAILIAQSGNGDGFSGLRQVLRMPQIYAAIAGLAARLSGLQLAERTDVLGGMFEGVALLADATLPFLLLILGMQLALGVEIEDTRLTALAAALRLLAAPFIAYGLARLLALDDLSLRVAVLQASMPSAVNMVLYSVEFNARPKFVAGVVVATTALGLVTLTVLLGVVRG